MTFRKPLIECRDLTFRYPGEEHFILKDLTCTIDEGEFLAIIGGNGSGKSTLCKAFNGLIPHFYVGDYMGQVKLDGVCTATTDVATLSQSIGYVYQDFQNQLLRPTAIEDACFMPLNYGLDDYKERGLWALEVTGLLDVQDEFIWRLSGGQQHLLALASAIAMRPKLLVIDEPIAQLDPHHAEQIYEVLKKLHTDYGITIIVIEHHTDFIANYCSHVMLLDEGKVLWKKETVGALNCVEDLLARNIFPPQVTQIAHSLQLAQPYPVTLQQAIQTFKTSPWKQQPTVHHLPTQSTPMVQLNNIELVYNQRQANNKLVLQNISLKLCQHEHIALVGNNGAGKSTLLKVIAGIVRPTSGQMYIREQLITKAAPEKLAQDVGFIFQNPEEMFIEDSVRKEISFYLKSRKVDNYEIHVDELLKTFELVDIQDQDARLLSGGQQRRVSLAIGAAMRPKILLLDEPTANLDIATKQHVLTLLKELKKYVQTIVIATHDMELVAEWSSRVVVLSNGRILADDTSERIFQNHSIMAAGHISAPQIVQLTTALEVPYCASVSLFIAGYLQQSERGVHVGMG
ncbi:ABC transporter ATP-binding protein [Psychrobacillus antarcticus]|uniref:ABC transporter ATP-binding protein n=1 Tax=Psychrobacillus antarcticus TaxID=2879115 RepID=UPI0024084BC4|nr:energy-coupling factor transporter ATPase [Psychrobacillus antarcticus]